MIAICWKCSYIFEIRGRYTEYRDRKGITHKTYRECPRCRSTAVIVRKSFNLNEMQNLLKQTKDDPGIVDAFSIAKRLIQERPARPKKVPGCWGSRAGRTFCRGGCAEHNGEETQNTCRQMTAWNRSMGKIMKEFKIASKSDSQSSPGSRTGRRGRPSDVKKEESEPGEEIEKEPRPEESKKSKSGKKPPSKPLVPTNAPNCYGQWIGDAHCKKKCDARKPCKKEHRYQEYNKGLLPDEVSQ